MCGSTTAARNRPSADTSYCVPDTAPTPSGSGVPLNAPPGMTNVNRGVAIPNFGLDSQIRRNCHQATVRRQKVQLLLIAAPSRLCPTRRLTLARAFQASGNSRRKSRSAPIDSRSRRPSGHRAIARLAGRGIRRFEMARTVIRASSSTRVRSRCSGPRTSSGRAVAPRPATSRGPSTETCSRSAASAVLIHQRRSSTDAPRERPRRGTALNTIRRPSGDHTG